MLLSSLCFRWNYWCAMSPDLLFSATLSHIDYAAVFFVYVLDLKTKRFEEATVLKPVGFGSNISMPTVVSASLAVKTGEMDISFTECEDGSTRIEVQCPKFGKSGALTADLLVQRPLGDKEESLNVVVPWSATRFQFTSKQPALPTHGKVMWDGKEYLFGNGVGAALVQPAVEGASSAAAAVPVEAVPVPAWACLDFGRGVWPYSSSWNWASFSGESSSGRRVGVNLGGRWTDGTGQNENGIVVDGKLTKIHLEVNWEYDSTNWMKPWKLTTMPAPAAAVSREAPTPAVAGVSVTFTPLFERAAASNVLVVRSEVHQMIGTFSGHIVTDDGELIEIENLQGWAEEHYARW